MDAHLSLHSQRYYGAFTSLYALSLLFSEYIMTNSSWTQGHIQTLLAAGRRSFLANVFLMDDQSVRRKMARGEIQPGEKAACEVVYPPCDTAGLVKLGNLDDRRRKIVSLAQFRWVWRSLPCIQLI